MFLLWLNFCVGLTSASSEGPISPPSQRRRGQDSSAGDLMPMPTSPATDGLNPAAPQDTSLFSSPCPSGPNNTTIWRILLELHRIANVTVSKPFFVSFCLFSFAKRSGHELPSDLWDT